MACEAVEWGGLNAYKKENKNIYIAYVKIYCEQKNTLCIEKSYLYNVHILCMRFCTIDINWPRDITFLRVGWG